MVGFFPTPYPDECLYSILCRYSARSGSAKYESISKTLFGRVLSPALSVYLPIRLECVDTWLPPASGISRRDIAVRHTLYPYWAVTLPSFRAELDELMDGQETVFDIHRAGSSKIRSSRVEYLKYCPMCAAEDIDKYGETYWHRQHQLAEMLYCVKHEVRLVDSTVSLDGNVMRFCPASSAINMDYDAGAPDDLALYKDELLKIGRECEWLIEHGLSVDWSANGYEKYWRLLRDKGMASFWGKSYYSTMDESFFGYWGKDFLDAFFDTINVPRFNGWYHKIGIDQASRFTPLFHILIMCWLADSVENFVDCNPADTPFGHPPFVCENLICSHYHIDGANMIKLVDYGSGKAAYFECTSCGLKYKYAKSTHSREQRVILDYGHLWDSELRRCCQDPKITSEQAMKILKCSYAVLQLQKGKRGLMNPVPDYMGMEPEAYYKTKVLEMCQEYDEVTIALLDEKVPRAYGYLQNHDYEWIRSRVVFDNERRFRLEREELLLTKLREMIATFEAEGYPDEPLTYGFIARLLDSTRDELRNKMSPNSELRAFLDNIVEHRPIWRHKRVAKIKENQSERGKLLLGKLLEIIATFEADGYPDKQLSCIYIAGLVGSTEDELRRKMSHNSELQALLDQIVEHRGVWRQERAAKMLECRSKRESLVRNAIEKILADPPLQYQISRNYIAQVAGLTRDILKEDRYLSELTMGIVESKLDWLKRRLIAAYYSKPIEGRPYSALAICRAASIDWSTYNKRRKLFEEMVNKLNLEH